MNEYTIVDTIQVTRIVKTDMNIEQDMIEENARFVISKLIGFDDAIVLDHKIFVRNVEDNNVDDMEEMEENE